MDATLIVAAVRRNLDDTPEDDYKQGLYYEPADILLALNASMLTITHYLALTQKSYLLENLISSVTGTGSTPLPDDYFMAVTALVDELPAQLFIGGGGRNYFYGGATFIAVEAGDIYFRKNGASATGTLRYYRKPYSMTTDSGADDFGESPDFGDHVLNAISRHATAALAIRLEANTRHIANAREALQLLVESNSQFAPEGVYR